MPAGTAREVERLAAGDHGQVEKAEVTTTSTLAALSWQGCKRRRNPFNPARGWKSDTLRPS
jgi:hypothetical protein